MNVFYDCEKCGKSHHMFYDCKPPELKSSSPFEQRARELHESMEIVCGTPFEDCPSCQAEVGRITEALRAVRAEALEEAARTCESSDRYRGEYFARLIREAKLNGDSKS